MTNKDSSKNIISPESYTAAYYKTSCLGYKEFGESGGFNLPTRFVKSLLLAKIQQGMRVADIGCGRGEIVLNSALLGAEAWGVDYSRNAVKMAKDAIDQFSPDNIKEKILIHQADARFLPFPANFFDRVFMLDIIEHLGSDELLQSFREVHRILKHEGSLIIHTVPNLWYYWLGYPIYRFFQNLRGIHLPEDPRKRSEFSELHINEQSPKKLKHYLRKCKYNSRVWLETTVDYGYENNTLVRYMMKFLVNVYPFRWIFCNDIFAIATKIE